MRKKKYLIPLFAILLLGIGFLCGVFLSEKKYVNSESVLKTTVVHTVKVQKDSAATSEYEIEVYNGNVEDGYIVWDGDIPKVYVELSPGELGSYQWIVINETKEYLEVARKFRWYRKKDDTWKEYRWQIDNVEDGIRVAPGTGSRINLVGQNLIPERGIYRFSVIASPYDGDDWWYITYEIEIEW